MSDITTKPTAVSRRSLLQGIISLFSLGIFAFIANASVRYLMPPAKLKKAKELSIPTAQIPRDSSLIVEYKGAPVIVVNSDGKFVAYSATCTHLGCIVKWVGNEKKFVCPCHAGKFDLSGKVVAGPPPEPLHTIDIEVVEDTITFV